MGFTAGALLALDFTGPDGTVTFPHDPDLQPATGTIEIWVNVAHLQDSDVVAAVTDCLLRTNPTSSPLAGGSVIGLGTAWATPPPDEFIGRMDGVRFYARARTDVEIFTDFITREHKPAKPPGE